MGRVRIPFAWESEASPLDGVESSTVAPPVKIPERFGRGGPDLHAIKDRMMSGARQSGLSSARSAELVEGAVQSAARKKGIV